MMRRENTYENWELEKYVETLKMFGELSKIAKGVSKEVQSLDEFDKLKHHVVEIHPLATWEIAIWQKQISKNCAELHS